MLFAGCLAAILCLTANALAASERKWDYITESKDGLVTFYGNHQNVTVNGAIRRAWLLYDYKEAQLDPDTLIANRSTIAVTLVDCPNRKLAGIEGTDYASSMGRGKIVSRSRQLPNAPPEYVPVKPGTPDDDVLNYVCSTALGADAQKLRRAKTGEGGPSTKR